MTKKKKITDHQGDHEAGKSVLDSGELGQKGKWLTYSSIGLMFPASIAVGLAAGYFLDEWFHSSPYLTIIFTLYGIAAGFVNLFRMTIDHGKKKRH